ncbi:hypothetical protein VTN96DRAFT_5058 [Rasamsonia emersonii]
MRSEGRKPADIKNLPNDAAPQAKDRSQQVSSHNQAAVNDQVLEEILSQLQTECHHLHQVRDRCNAWTTAYLKAMDEEEPNLDVNKALFLLISARLLNKSSFYYKDTTNGANNGAKPDRLSGSGANKNKDPGPYLGLPRRESDRPDPREPACKPQQSDWKDCIDTINGCDASYFKGKGLDPRKVFRS